MLEGIGAAGNIWESGALALSLFGYIGFNELVLKKRSKKVADIRVAMLEARMIEQESRRKDLEIQHENELKQVETTMKYRNDLVMVEKELLEEERNLYREESRNEQEAACRGKFKVLKYDILEKFRDVLRVKAADFICPRSDGDPFPVPCSLTPAITEANLKAYEKVLDEGFEAGEKLAWGFILWNGYYELKDNPEGLDKYLDEKNKEIHRTIWGIVINSAPPALIEGLDVNRATESFTLKYWRDLILTVIRIKNQEKFKINKSKDRFEAALRKIYGDRRGERK